MSEHFDWVFIVSAVLAGVGMGLIISATVDVWQGKGKNDD